MEAAATGHARRVQARQFRGSLSGVLSRGEAGDLTLHEKTLATLDPAHDIKLLERATF
jgi:hypothetical protein